MSIQSDRWKRETPTPACATQLQSARTLVLGKPCRNEMISGFNTNSQNSRIKLIKKIILPPRIAFGNKFISNLLTGTKFIELTATSSGTEFMEDLQLEQSSWRIFYWNKVLKTSSFFRNKFLRIVATRPLSESENRGIEQHTEPTWWRHRGDASREQDRRNCHTEHITGSERG